MDEGRAEVEILGHRIVVRGRGSTEHIRQVAHYLDHRIRLVREQVRIQDPVRLSLLAGLHVADELFRSREAEARLLAQVESLAARLGAAVSDGTGGRADHAHLDAVGSAGA